MGCDIHPMVEVRGEDGRWTAITDPIFKGWNDELTTEPYSGRNYDLFAILAGVRNYENIEPIDDPRGVPPDASPEWRALVADWNGDGHSHSWLTLADLTDFDWGSGRPQSGVFDEETYRAGKEYPRSRAVYGGGVVVLAERDYPPVPRDPSKSYYVDRTWIESHAKAVGSFCTETIPALAALGEPEDVRLLFFFDN